MVTSLKFGRRLGIAALTIAPLAAVAVVWIISQSPSSTGVRLSFRECKRWADSGKYYAEFQLVNNTTGAIEYPLIRDAGPKDTVALCRDGKWKPVQWDNNTKGEVFQFHRLKPGNSVTLIVPLTTGAAPKQFAIPCRGIPELKRSAVSKRLRRWLIPVGRVVRIQITPPEFLAEEDQRVWCSDLIAAPQPNQLRK